MQGALIEVAAGKMLSPEQFLDFHRRIYAGRGADRRRARHGGGEGPGPRSAEALAAVANTEATLNVLRKTPRSAARRASQATPAYVIGGVAILGHPGLKPLQQLVGAMRACGKVVC